MTLTDEELSGLITARFSGSSLKVDLAQVQRRGRQRRRNTRISMAAAAIAGVVGMFGAVTFGVSRHDEALQVAAFDRACQASYTAEAANTLRAAQLPAKLDAPVLELRRADARFRLYTSAPGPLRSMIFDCARMADGSVSGRISFGSTIRPELGQPLIAYRDYLPDGTVAIVAQLRDPAGALSVTPASRDVQVAQRGDMAVVWGPRSALADATLSVHEGGLNLARDTLAMTATYQEQEFEQQCRQNLTQRPALSGASLRLTASPGNWVVKVYRNESSLAVCSWANLPDDPANGLSYNGPAISLASIDNAVPGTVLMLIDIDGSNALVAGAIPQGTERVDVVTEDGTTAPGEIGDGVYVAHVSGDGKKSKVIMTTATTIYTYAGGEVTQRPR